MSQALSWRWRVDRGQKHAGSLLSSSSSRMGERDVTVLQGDLLLLQRTARVEARSLCPSGTELIQSWVSASGRTGPLPGHLDSQEESL